MAIALRPGRDVAHGFFRCLLHLAWGGQPGGEDSADDAAAAAEGRDGSSDDDAEAAASSAMFQSMSREDKNSAGIGSLASSRSMFAMPRASPSFDGGPGSSFDERQETSGRLDLDLAAAYVRKQSVFAVYGFTRLCF